MAIINYPADNASLILDGTSLTEFGEGAYITLAPINPVSESTNSANGGLSVNERLDRDEYNLTVQVQRNGANDTTINGWRNQSPVKILDGSLKIDFLRNGQATKENWQFEGGRMTDQPTTTINNQDGEMMTSWVFRFRSAVRSL